MSLHLEAELGRIKEARSMIAEGHTNAAVVQLSDILKRALQREAKREQIEKSLTEQEELLRPDPSARIAELEAERDALMLKVENLEAALAVEAL